MLTEPSKTFLLSELCLTGNKMTNGELCRQCWRESVKNYPLCVLERSHLQIKLWENPQARLSCYREWRLCVCVCMCRLTLVMLSLMSGNNVAIAPTVKAGGPRSASVNMADPLRPTCVCVCLCMFPIHRPVLKRIRAPDSPEGSLLFYIRRNGKKVDKEHIVGREKNVPDGVPAVPILSRR